MVRSVQIVQVWGIYKKKYVEEQKKRPPMRCAFLVKKDAEAIAKFDEVVLDAEAMYFTDDKGGSGSHYSLVPVKVYKHTEHHREEVLRELMSRLTPEERDILFPKSEIAKGGIHD